MIVGVELVSVSLRFLTERFGAAAQREQDLIASTSTKGGPEAMLVPTQVR